MTIFDVTLGTLGAGVRPIPRATGTTFVTLVAAVGSFGVDAELVLCTNVTFGLGSGGTFVMVMAASLRVQQVTRLAG